MYVVFGPIPPFHLQVFSLEGELVRCLIPKSEISFCYFFSIDQFGNIIVADWFEDRIKIFTNKGKLVHTINSDMLPGDHKFVRPRGVAVNKHDNIIVAHNNKECSLMAF